MGVPSTFLMRLLTLSRESKTRLRCIEGGSCEAAALESRVTVEVTDANYAMWKGHVGGNHDDGCSQGAF